MNGDTQTPDEGNAPQKPDVATSLATPVATLPEQPVVQPTTLPQSQPAPVTPTAEATSQPKESTPPLLAETSDVAVPETTPAFTSDIDEQDYGFTPEERSPAVDNVTWTASEFIAHEKTGLWYVTLAGATALLVVIIFFLVHDLVAVIAIIFVAIIFGFLAAHKPRVLTYSITPAGLTIEGKTYLFSDFKSYGVINEGAFSSVTFMPLKRFMPTLSIYYPPEQEIAIVDALSNYLPFAPASHDLIDRLMHRIRL